MFKKEFSADVVISGAGTAGSAAAIAAADQGLSVLLIEQFGAAGGSGSIGLVTPIMSSHIKGNPQCSYIAEEINARMEALGAGTGASFFDPGMLPFVLEKMLIERSVKVLFHTTVTEVVMDGRRIDHLVLAGKSGKMKASGKYYIDCTGDSDLSVLAGFPTLHGDETTGKNQPVSLRYLVGGIDVKTFRKFLRDIGIKIEAPYFSGSVCKAKNSSGPLDDIFMKAIDAGDLIYEDAVYWQFFTVPGRDDTIAFNCPEYFDIHDADDTESLTFVQLDGKQSILRQLLFYRKYLPGFEKSYISSVSGIVGIRESRRAVTDYIMTVEDIVSHRKFQDAICQSNYPVDVHGRTLNLKQLNAAASDDRPYYELPLGCLIVRDADNLLAAGRNLGSEFAAQSSIRVIHTCRAMGEAAGIACAFAEKAGSLRSVDGALVREEMRRRGARFVCDVQ
ncbi:MAG: FAD-dependent oxidoreductase [Clostridia bacterium]|nr:FAD-dependent oxidoreductase [Clostridia bacterium]